LLKRDAIEYDDAKGNAKDVPPAGFRSFSTGSQIGEGLGGPAARHQTVLREPPCL